MDLSKQTLLVVAPHPDDEVLGCGGFIKKIKKLGGKVYVLFLTLGDTQDYSDKGTSTFEERKKEVEDVASFLKIDGWDIAFTGNKYHLKLDSIPQKEIIDQIEKGSKVSIDTTIPTMIATTQHADYNQDHRACSNAVLASTRPAPNSHKHCPNIVLGYEFTATVNWGPEPFLQRNLYITLTEDEINAKQEAMQRYSSQIRNGAHTRALEHITNLAKIRGASCGKKYAEAYHLYKMTL